MNPRHLRPLLAAWLALAVACAPPEAHDEPTAAPTREPATAPAESPPEPAEPPRPRPVLRFAFRIADAQSVPVTSTLDDAADIVFEATDGQEGEVLRSVVRREGDRDVSYCEVITSAGRGWVPEEHLANLSWEGVVTTAGTAPPASEASGAREDAAATERVHGVSIVEMPEPALLRPSVGPTLGDVATVSPAGSPQPFDASSLITRGQYTIVDYYSDFCGPCRRLAPVLEQAASASSQMVLRKVNVDRPGSKSIDWGSPILKQYGITSLPHVELYGPGGALEATNQSAVDRIVEIARQR